MIRGLAELGPTTAEAASQAGVWAKIKALGDQTTIRHAEIIIGVAPGDAPLDELLERGCGLMTRTGGLLVHNRELRCYGEPCNANDMVEVHLDMQAAQLSFSCNGCPMGVAFDESILRPMGPLRAFVALALPGASVRLKAGGSTNMANSDPCYSLLRSATLS